MGNVSMGKILAVSIYIGIWWAAVSMCGVFADDKGMVVVIKHEKIKLLCEVDHLSLSKGNKTKEGKQKVVIECTKFNDRTKSE